MMTAAFGPLEEAEAEDCEFPIIGKPGTRGKSARPRAGTEHAEGAGDGIEAAETAAAVKESEKKKR